MGERWQKGRLNQTLVWPLKASSKKEEWNWEQQTGEATGCAEHSKFREPGLGAQEVGTRPRPEPGRSPLQQIS